MVYFEKQNHTNKTQKNLAFKNNILNRAVFTLILAKTWNCASMLIFLSLLSRSLPSSTMDTLVLYNDQLEERSVQISYVNVWPLDLSTRIGGFMNGQQSP